MDKSNERVLVIPEQRLQVAGAFTGFRPFDDQFLRTLLEPAFLSYRPRGEVETDPSFKQLIPYVVLHWAGQIFQYTRGQAGGEKRLQSLRSIGIGGHINEEDGTPTAEPYQTGMRRELYEEVAITAPYRERYLGFIFDPSTPVGEVHLGIVHWLDLEQPLAKPREEAIHKAGFRPVRDLIQQISEFETWSQLVLEEIASRTA